MTTITTATATFDTETTSLKALKAHAAELWTGSDEGLQNFAKLQGHRGKKATWVTVIEKLDAGDLDTVEPAIPTDQDVAMQSLAADKEITVTVAPTLETLLGIKPPIEVHSNDCECELCDDRTLAEKAEDHDFDPSNPDGDNYDPRYATEKLIPSPQALIVNDDIVSRIPSKGIVAAIARIAYDIVNDTVTATLAAIRKAIATVKTYKPRRKRARFLRDMAILRLGAMSEYVAAQA